MTELDPNAAEVATQFLTQAHCWCRICQSQLQILHNGRHFRLWCRRCKQWRRGRNAIATPPVLLHTDE